MILKKLQHRSTVYHISVIDKLIRVLQTSYQVKSILRRRSSFLAWSDNRLYPNICFCFILVFRRKCYNFIYPGHFLRALRDLKVQSVNEATPWMVWDLTQGLLIFPECMTRITWPIQLASMLCFSNWACARHDRWLTETFSTQINHWVDFWVEFSSCGTSHHSHCSSDLSVCIVMLSFVNHLIGSQEGGYIFITPLSRMNTIAWQVLCNSWREELFQRFFHFSFHHFWCVSHNSPYRIQIVSCWSRF